MRKSLLLATILATGLIGLATAQAAPRPLLGQSAMSGLSTVREAGEAPRREDRQADRRQDRRADRDVRDNGKMARESSEAPRGKDGPHDRNRSGGRSSMMTPGGFDASGIILAREAGEGARGEGKGHP